MHFLQLSLAILTTFFTLNLALPDGWTQGNLSEPSTILQFRIAVRSPAQAEFDQLAIDIATPGHIKYGEFLGRDDIKDFLRPSSSVSKAILTWLRAGGISDEHIEDEGDWIHFVARISEAQTMFKAKYYDFHNGKRTISRTLAYSLPADLHQHIQFIHPTTWLGNASAHTSSVFRSFDVDDQNILPGYDAAFCNNTMTPACLRHLYRINDFIAGSHPLNSLGIGGFLEQWVQYADIQRFIDALAPYAINSSLAIHSISGGVNPQGVRQNIDTSEANLDVQYGLALAANTSIVYYSTAGRPVIVPDLDQPVGANQNEPYLDLLHYLLSLDDLQLPKVLSISYGENEQSVPEEASRVICSLFGKLGARGTSVIVSSGDTGVGSACQTNDGKNTTRLLPVFPASCPFVTAVGGTKNIEPEVAAAFSSGGFSDRFPRPSYQDQAVTAYLQKLGGTWAGLFNPDGRGFPDISAQSVNFTIYDRNSTRKVSGTSCSAPAFAGIVAALNSILLSQGKPSLGFLNPWIYKQGFKGFTDILQGGSTGCTGESIYSGLASPKIPGASWAAIEGWDPVTGFGTPIFPDLVDLIQET